jgi:hypothetical protein
VAKARAIAIFINSSEHRLKDFRTLQTEFWEANRHLSKRARLYLLRCFQDVKTRWDSTYHMLARLRELKPHVDPYTKQNCTHLHLSDEEWGQIDYVISILRPFAIYTQLIGASRLPTIHQVFDIYNHLLSHIERAIEKLEKKKQPWKVEIYTALQSANEKLKQYYSATAGSDAGQLYGIAILLDPRKKSLTWQGSDWRGDDVDWEAHYWKMFESMYTKHYANRTLTTRRRAVPPGAQPRNHVNLDSVIDGLNMARNMPENRRGDSAKATDAIVEFDDYKVWSKFSGCVSGCMST